MPNTIDLAYQPNDKIEVEVQQEASTDKLKLYVHYNGQTILRICKIPHSGLVFKSPHFCMSCGCADYVHNEDGICTSKGCTCLAYKGEVQFP